MTISVVNPQSAEGGAVNSLTLSSYDSQSSGSGILVVGVLDDDSAGDTIDDVTFNSVSLTSSAGLKEVSSSQTRSEIWYMFAPDGTNDIVVTFSDTVGGCGVGAIILEGAVQQAPEADNKQTTTGEPSDLSVTTLTDGAMLIDSHAQNVNAAQTVTQGGSGQTERVDQITTGSGNGLAMSSLLTVSLGSHTVGWNLDGGDWARGAHVVAVWAAVKPAIMRRRRAGAA